MPVPPCAAADKGTWEIHLSMTVRSAFAAATSSSALLAIRNG